MLSQRCWRALHDMPQMRRVSGRVRSALAVNLRAGRQAGRRQRLRGKELVGACRQKQRLEQDVDETARVHPSSQAAAGLT
jgi:hypothetical protein